MRNKKIIIAGGSGFIGQELCNYFGRGNEIIILGRQLPGQEANNHGQNSVEQEVRSNLRFVKWDALHLGDWTSELEGAELLINLTGKSVNCRYTEKNKTEIFSSRTEPTKLLGEAIRKAVHPPKLWINAASATIYPHATSTPRDESFTDFADDFSVQVCQLWEHTFMEQRTPFTRKAALRMAITLGAGGVMVPYFNLLKFGLGGRQGYGEQMYSWIHIHDTCRMIDWIAEHTELEGIYNCSSPGAITNAVFMKTLREATGTRFGLPAFSWMLKMGGRIIGTEAELVLKSRWVLPSRIQATGFRFRYETLAPALEEIISKTPQRLSFVW